MKTLKRLGQRFKRPPRANGKSSADADALTPVLVAILAARALLHDQIGQSAHNGAVADALPRALAANHAEELRETRRQLGQERNGFRACLLEIEAAFPEPEPPAEEPPAPRPGRSFPRLGRMLNKGRPPGSGTHH